jgi:EpsD family peptidyl-prolyl cis-trans isomerase
MPNIDSADPKVRRAVQDQTLQSIIARKVLAAAARKSGVEKSADFVMVRKRAEEALLAQAFQKQLADAVPAPSDDEVNQFISSNPNLFREHKVLMVEQIRVAGMMSQALLQKLQPLKTLDDVAALLQSEKVGFARGAAQLDSLALGPEITASALKIGSSDLFVLPGQQVTLVNRLVEARTNPILGDDAKKVASEFLKARHTKDAVQRGVQENFKAAASTVSYNPSYKPAGADAAAAKPGDARK